MIFTLAEVYCTFDPFLIADHENIEYQYADIGEIKGQYIPNVVDKSIILLNQTLEYSNERYTVMAHELGHALLHPDLSSYYSFGKYQKSKVENEANFFSVHLMYEFCCEELSCPPTSIYELQTRYGISEDLLEHTFK
ncbi:MAG: ImmA/IrrE family metallo-endopeptidase [Lactobacillales bacterium]|nr:ImmA/IrrE family metallo-endopeptidase [Lactobacillales bacterium]